MFVINYILVMTSNLNRKIRILYFIYIIAIMYSFIELTGSIPNIKFYTKILIFASTKRLLRNNL